MFKKKLVRLFIGILCAFSALSFSACDNTVPISSISMANTEVLEVPFGNFSYDGIKVNVNYQDGNVTQIDLTEDMISLSEQLKFYKMGEQEIKVSFRDKFYTTMKINVTLNTFKDIYKLEDVTVTYDGLPHSVVLNEELPEGATIQYPYGNSFSSTGVYEVVGVITKDGYESRTLKATLTINPAERESDKIIFNDARFVFNGEMRTVEAHNVPDGVNVDYDTYDYDTGIKINKIVNVGKYKVVAKFTDSNANYKKISDMEAIVTVVKGDYDMSAFTLTDVTKTYDGEEYDMHVANEEALPSGVSVIYSYYKDGKLVESNIACGTYVVIADFKGGDVDNYNPINSIQATLKVEPVYVNLVNKVFFDGVSWTYGDDIKSLSVELDASFPKAYKTSYEYKFYKEDGTLYVNGDYVNAGNYKITCDFYSTDENVFFITDNLIGYININPLGLTVAVSSLTVTNGVANAVVVTTDDEPEVIDDIIIKKIEFFTEDETPEEVAIDQLVPGTEYKYRLSLTYTDPGKAQSIELNGIEGTYTHSA